MANYSNLLATIAANIYTNNNNEVTAAMVKTTVDQMVASLGAGYQFMGVATPSTTPGSTDIKQFYIASEPGTYTDFLDSLSNPLAVNDGEVAILKYTTAWSKEATGVSSAQKLGEFMARVGYPDYIDMIHHNRVIDEDGTVGNHTTRSTFVIPLNGATKIISISGAGTINCLSWYSSEPNYIDTTGFINRVYFPSFPLTAPSGAAFAVADFTNVNLTQNIAVELYGSTDTLVDGLNELNSKIAPLNPTLKNFAANPAAGYYDASGNFSLSEYWLAMAMDVSEYQGKGMTLTGVGTINQGAATFFKLSDNTTQRIYSPDNVTPNVLTIPNNASYLYYSAQRVVGASCIIDGVYDIDYVTQAELDNALSSISDNSYNLKKRESVVSFIFDDNNDADQNMKQYCDDKGIKCGFAVINVLPRYVTYASEGFDILAHGNLPGSWTEASLRSLIESDLSAMAANGIDCVGWVTPSSELPEALRPIVYDYFEYGYTIYKGLQTSDVYMPATLKSYGLWRSDMDTLSEAQCKAIIDEGVANNAMVCFYSHTSITENKFKNIIDYALANSQIMSPTHAVRYFFAHRHNEDD